MTTEELQKKYDRLYEKIKRLRGWQREYKKYHIESDRQIVVRLEREVDQMIKIETDLQKRKQNELF